MTLLLTLPFAVAFLAIPGTIMRAIFAHGAFDQQAAALSAAALAAYGVGPSGHGAGADRGVHFLCPPRHA